MPKQNTQPARVLMVIPTLGQRLDLLEETLTSLTKQKYPLDIVVVCPLKNKAAVDLAKKFGAAVVEDPGTLSGAVNVGFAAAKKSHDYVCWMGDDDLLAANALAATVPTLDTNPEAVIAFGYCDYIDDSGKRIFTSRAGKLAPWVITWGPNLVPLPGMLYRLSAVRKAGEFDTGLKYAMDLDMLLRLRKLGRFINTGQTLGSFRWHSTSTTVANRNASLKETEMVKRRYLPKPLRALAPLWELPVRVATRVAARRVSNLSAK
jgi:GT2 family glycosyltransferase